jgi:hypothetical protein
VKIWEKGFIDPQATISINTPINSLNCGFVNGEATYLLAGTFHGGVALISI